MITFKDERNKSRELNNIYVLLLITSITGFWTALPFIDYKIHLFHIVLVYYGIKVVQSKDLVIDKLQGLKQVRPYLLFFIIWYFYMIISVFWVDSKLLYVTNLSIYTLMFLLIFIIVFKNQHEKILLFTIKVLGIIYSLSLLIGLIEGLFGIKIFNSPFMRKDLTLYSEGYLSDLMTMPTTFFVNPNNYGTFLVFSISFLLAYSLFGGNRRTKNISYILYFLSLLVLYFTNSRGNILALGISGILFGLIGLYIKGYKELIRIGLITIFLVLIILTPNLINSGDTILAFKKDVGVDNSIEWRINVIDSGLNLMRFSPLGYGLGNGKIQVAKEINKNYINLHNWFLEVLMDFGILFFILYLFFYIKLVYDLFKIVKNGKNNKVRFIATGCLLSLLSFILAMASPSTVIYFYPFWILKGIGIATVNVSRENRLYPEFNSIEY